MSKPVRQSSSRALRLGALLLTLASFGACATPQSGFASASTSPSQPARWGFATLSESAQPGFRGYAQIPQPPQPELWGYAEQSPQTSTVVQAAR
jgi:hypothetical protein